MKTTTQNSTSKNPTDLSEAGKIQTIIKAKPSQSARPMKSMVRARSLKPQRIELSTKLRRKPIKA